MGRAYNVWDVTEENALRTAVQKHGVSAWEIMRHDPEFRILSTRTGVQLKDKWRNLVKFNHLGRGEVAAAPAGARRGRGGRRKGGGGRTAGEPRALRKGAAAEEPEPMSEIEQQRLDNIRRNQEALAALMEAIAGLSMPAKEAKRVSRKPPTRAWMPREVSDAISQREATRAEVLAARAAAVAAEAAVAHAIAAGGRPDAMGAALARRAAAALDLSDSKAAALAMEKYIAEAMTRADEGRSRASLYRPPERKSQRAATKERKKYTEGDEWEGADPDDLLLGGGRWPRAGPVGEEDKRFGIYDERRYVGGEEGGEDGECGEAGAAGAAGGAEEEIVNCICGVDFDDGEAMVECEKCQIWVHTRCLEEAGGEVEGFVCTACKSRRSRKKGLPHRSPEGEAPPAGAAAAGGGEGGGGGDRPGRGEGKRKGGAGGALKHPLHKAKKSRAPRKPAGGKRGGGAGGGEAAAAEAAEVEAAAAEGAMEEAEGTYGAEEAEGAAVQHQAGGEGAEGAAVEHAVAAEEAEEAEGAAVQHQAGGDGAEGAAVEHAVAAEEAEEAEGAAVQHQAGGDGAEGAAVEHAVAAEEAEEAEEAEGAAVQHQAGGEGAEGAAVEHAVAAEEAEEAEGAAVQHQAGGEGAGKAGGASDTVIPLKKRRIDTEVGPGPAAEAAEAVAGPEEAARAEAAEMGVGGGWRLGGQRLGQPPPEEGRVKG